jgi:hypothetical protein
VGVTGIGIDGVNVQEITITAAIDTGSTLIYLPMHAVESLYGHIPGAKPAKQYSKGFWTYPCSARFQISLQFEMHSTAFSIHPWDFNLGRIEGETDQCMGGILGLPDGFPEGFAIIGDEFLKNCDSFHHPPTSYQADLVYYRRVLNLRLWQQWASWLCIQY